MNVEQCALTFDCGGEQLFGLASVPAPARVRGVLVIVGGPQYRVGSHRQFTLLARDLAARGHPVMRFDYRGMGDSEGAQRGFDRIGDDVRAALDQFFYTVPELREVVLWGLCDAASAAMYYACGDSRVSGLVLVNPWARTDAGLAKATIKHYYGQRLLEGAFWKKVARGQFNFTAAARSFASLATTALRGRRQGQEEGAPSDAACELPLRERMLDSLCRFSGKVLLITSGADLTAREFLDMESASPAWKQTLARPGTSRFVLADADHTFSRRAWTDQVAKHTADWIESW